MKHHFALIYIQYTFTSQTPISTPTPSPACTVANGCSHLGALIVIGIGIVPVAIFMKTSLRCPKKVRAMSEEPVVEKGEE